MKKEEKRFQQSLAALVKDKAKDGLKTKQKKGKTATKENFIKSYLCQALTEVCLACTRPCIYPYKPNPCPKDSYTLTWLTVHRV